MRRRVRRSTVVLIAIFVATLVLYVLIRPEASPAIHSAPTEITPRTSTTPPLTESTSTTG